MGGWSRENGEFGEEESDGGSGRLVLSRDGKRILHLRAFLIFHWLVHVECGVTSSSSTPTCLFELRVCLVKRFEQI